MGSMGYQHYHSITGTPYQTAEQVYNTLREQDVKENGVNGSHGTFATSHGVIPSHRKMSLPAAQRLANRESENTMKWEAFHAIPVLSDTVVTARETVIWVNMPTDAPTRDWSNPDSETAVKTYWDTVLTIAKQNLRTNPGETIAFIAVDDMTSPMHDVDVTFEKNPTPKTVYILKMGTRLESNTEYPNLPAAKRAAKTAAAKHPALPISVHAIKTTATVNTTITGVRHPVTVVLEKRTSPSDTVAGYLFYGSVPF